MLSAWLMTYNAVFHVLAGCKMLGVNSVHVRDQPVSICLLILARAMRCSVAILVLVTGYMNLRQPVGPLKL